MKVKLLKVDAATAHPDYSKEVGCRFYFGGDDQRNIIEGISDWEEITYEEYYTLQKWVTENAGFLLLSFTKEGMVKRSIEEMVKIQDERFKEVKKKEEAAKAKYKKMQEAKKVKKLENLRKELARLESLEKK